MDKTGIAYKAVAEFTATVNRKLPKEVHELNIIHDAWIYEWNWQTVEAMKMALNSLYNEITYG